MDACRAQGSCSVFKITSVMELSLVRFGLDLLACEETGAASRTVDTKLLLS